MNNKIAIQMDDIKTIDFDFDSSFIIGLEGQKRNYDLFYYHPDDLFIDQGEVKAKGFFLELFDQKTNYFKFLSDKTEVNLEKGFSPSDSLIDKFNSSWNQSIKPIYQDLIF